MTIVTSPVCYLHPKAANKRQHCNRLALTTLQMLSRLHKSTRVSSRCSFFAGAAGRFDIPCALQQRKTVGAAARITWSLLRSSTAFRTHKQIANRLFLRVISQT